MVQWLIVALYVAALFVFTGNEISGTSFTGRLLARWLPHLGSTEIKDCLFILRKVGHILAYGMLTLIVYRAALKTPGIRRAPKLFTAAFALIVAVADEGYQRFLVHRTGSWADVLIDGAGIAVMILAIALRAKLQEKSCLEAVEETENKLM